MAETMALWADWTVASKEYKRVDPRVYSSVAQLDGERVVDWVALLVDVLEHWLVEWKVEWLVDRMED